MRNALVKAAADPATDAAGKRRTLCHCRRSRGPSPRKRESYVELRFDYRRRRCGGDDPRGPQNSSLAFGDNAGGEAGRRSDSESLEDRIHCNLRAMRDPGFVWANPPFHGLRLSTERAFLRGRLRPAVFLWAASALATDRLERIGRLRVYHQPPRTGSPASSGSGGAPRVGSHEELCAARNHYRRIGCRGCAGMREQGRHAAPDGLRLPGDEPDERE